MNIYINPLFIIEWNTEKNMVFRNLRSGKDYVCGSGSENLLKVLSKFQEKGGYPRDSIAMDDTSSVDYLIDKGILIDEEEFLKTQNELRSWNKYEWRDAMLYHYGSDKPGYIEPYVADWESARMEEHEKYLRESSMPDIYKSLGSQGTVSIKGDVLPVRELDMMQLLLSRRTVRNFTDERVDLDTLHSIFYYATTSVRDIRKILVWAMQDSDGICLLKQSEYTALEFYIIIHNCEGIQPGIYHFNLEHLTFDLLEVGDYRNEVKSIQMGQSVLNNSAFSMYIAIDFHKQMWRYRYAHKYRALLIQIGKIAQDFITYALAFGIGSFMSPAIKDTEAENLLQLDPTHEGVGYFMSFGKFNAKSEASYFFTNLPGKSEKDIV